MSQHYTSMSDPYPNFIICTVINWVGLFTHRLYKKSVIACLNEYREKEQLQIFGYCIMTSQIYLVLATEDEALGSICSALKQDISLRLKKRILENPQETRGSWMLPVLKSGENSDPDNNFQLWEDHFHPIPLTSRQLADQKLEYLHRRPVTAGYVKEPEDYLYSSARNYAAKEAVLDIDTDLETVFSSIPN